MHIVMQEMFILPGEEVARPSIRPHYFTRKAANFVD